MTLSKRLTEWLLGSRSESPGQGTTWSITHDFPWPTWLLLVLVATAISFVVLVYRRDAGHLAPWRRRALTLLRISSLAVTLLFLSQALLSVERTGLPYLLVMIDTSASMGTLDRYSRSDEAELARRLAEENRLGPPTRLAQAQGLLLADNARLLHDLAQNHKLRVYAVAESDAVIGPDTVMTGEDIEKLAVPLRELVPVGRESRLGEGLRNSLNTLRGSAPTAVVMLTDGITTDGEPLATAARFARQNSVPVFPVILGSTDPLLDLEIHGVLADDTAFLGEPLAFTFSLTGQGCAGRSVIAALKNETTGEILATREARVTEDGRPQKLELSFTPSQVGELVVVLEVTELPDELNTANNREVRRISVRDEKLKVLLVDRLPRWEFRQLKDLLGREKTVELKTVLADADPEFTNEDRTALRQFPVTREDLFAYDVCIVGDIPAAMLTVSVQDNLRQFVSERGRGLLFIAGPRNNPETFRNTALEPLLPVDLAGVRKPGPQENLLREFKPKLTAEARQGSALFRFGEGEAESQQIWDFLPGFYWSTDVANVKPGAITYMVHPQRLVEGQPVPLIVTQRFGNGKTMYHGVDEIWRWRYRLGDTYYGRYWVQLLRYLSRSTAAGAEGGAELVSDRKSYQPGEAVQLRLKFLDPRLIPQDPGGVQVVIDGGTEQQLVMSRATDVPDVFVGQFVAGAAGAYHAFVAAPALPGAAPAVDFEVRGSLRETQVVRPETVELQQIAKATGGRAYTLANVDQLSTAIPPGLPVPLEPETPFKLWNHWLALAMFCGLLTLEWALRKRWRLV